MAVISEFLVALGFDGQDFEKGLKKAESDLGLFRSTALQVGATLGGALSLKALTLDFSKQNLQLDQMAKKLGVARDSIHGLDIAFQAFGASEGEAVNLLESISEKLARTRVLGDKSFAQDLARSGITNVDSIIKSRNSYEALLQIAEQAQHLSLDKRQTLAGALGLTPASLDLVTQGREKISKLSNEFGRVRPHYQEMVDASRSFTEEWARMMNNVGGALDPVATELTKFSTRVFQVISTLTSEGSTVRDVLDGVARNVDKVAVALGALAVGKAVGSLYRLAKAFALVKMSAGGVAGLVAGLGFIVAPEIAGAMAERNAKNPENFEYDGLHADEPEVVIRPYEHAKAKAVDSAKLGDTVKQDRNTHERNLVIQLNMDGQVIDERIVRINEQSAREVTESYKSRTLR